MNNDSDWSRLRSAYRQCRLTLYLGAGVSIGSGVPSWNQLVHALYFAAVDAEQAEREWRWFPNYLFAASEWLLQQRPESPDILASRIRSHYRDDSDELLKNLHRWMYTAFVSQDTGEIMLPSPQELCSQNPTLASIVKLCQSGNPGTQGVRSVITYNYDNLLETALGNTSHTPIWQSHQKQQPKQIPIFHVHGYLPMRGEGSTLEELVFTEDQYYLASHNAYAWGNLTQLKYLSTSKGLMVGLSLTDRNMRRLLDALSRAPLRTENFALLRRPQWQPPEERELDAIHQKAREYRERFARSGIKASERRSDEITSILHRLHKMEIHENTQVLKQLGIQPLWYDDHAEIPVLLQYLLS
jgi:hypothetical protein